MTTKTTRKRRTKQANRTGERPTKYATATGATRWRARYSIPAHLSPTGKRVQRMITGATAEEVQARINAAVAEVRAERVVDDRKTFAQFVEQWRKTILPGEGLAPKTVHTYDEMLRLYVIPAIGHRTLSGRNAVTVTDIERMLAAMRAPRPGKPNGLSVKTQQHARVVAGKILRAAVDRELVARNVVSKVRAPRDEGQAKAPKALSGTETAAVLAAVAGTRWHPMTLVAFATGLRPGELQALHWNDVTLDGDEPKLTVNYSLSHARGYPEVKAPKRKRSYRTVALPAEAVAALRAWRTQQNEERLACDPGVWPEHGPFAGLVFTTPYGQPHRDSSFRNALDERTGGETGVPKCTPHQCRHTYATGLLEAGAAIHHVAEAMGDTVGTVENVYSHVLRPKYELAALASRLFA